MPTKQSNLRWLLTKSLADLEETLMASIEQFQAAFAAIDQVTTEIAVEVARLRGIIQGGGLSADQEAEVLASLNQVEVALRAIASEPPA